MEKVSSKPPLFTNRMLVSLTIPVIIDALLSIITGIVDSAMVSSAGDAAVSGVSLVDSVNNMFITMFSGLGAGGAVITTQYIGSRNYAQARASARQLIYLTCGIGTILMCLLLSCAPQLLQLIYGSIEADVFYNAKSYFYITLLGYPFFAIGSSCAVLLRSMGKNRQMVILTAGVNVLNFFGNAIFVYGCGMGAAGAALSTTLVRVIYAAGGILMLRRKDRPIYLEHMLRFRIDWSMMRRVFKIGISGSIQSSFFNFGKLLIASLVSTFGTIYIAANSVSSYLCNIGWVITGAFGTVLMTVVGQCIGAGEPEQAKRYVRKLLGASAIFTYTAFPLVILLRNHLVLLFDFSPEALEASAYFTAIGAGLTMLAIYPLSFNPYSAFRAAGDIVFPTVLASVSMFVCRVGVSYLLCYGFGMGLMGVWLGCFADWICHTIFALVRFRSGKWLNKSLV